MRKREIAAFSVPMAMCLVHQPKTPIEDLAPLSEGLKPLSEGLNHQNGEGKQRDNSGLLRLLARGSFSWQRPGNDMDRPHFHFCLLVRHYSY
jgi:hypothetical protein